MEKLALLVLCLLAPGFAQSQSTLFQEGNALYAEGKFSEAAQKYQSAADGGLRSWILEYNLGNAYYREGRIGKAVLHFERAFQLNSGKGDVIYNLGLASTKAGDPKFPSSALLVLAWRIFFSLSMNTLAVVVSLLFIILGTASTLTLFGRPYVRREVAGFLSLLFVAAAFWLGGRIYVAERPVGIVVTNIAELRSGPSTTYPANFTIPEGHRVLFLEELESIQGWRQVGIPREGARGWVPESAVEAITRG